MAQRQQQKKKAEASKRRLRVAAQTCFRLSEDPDNRTVVQGDTFDEDLLSPADVDRMLTKQIIEVVGGDRAVSRAIPSDVEIKRKEDGSSEETRVANVPPLGVEDAIDPQHLASMDLAQVNQVAVDKGAKAPFNTKEEAVSFLSSNFG